MKRIGDVVWLLAFVAFAVTFNVIYTIAYAIDYRWWRRMAFGEHHPQDWIVRPPKDK